MADTLTINDRSVAMVCDRMLTAAIGPNWRTLAPESVAAFWMDEVRAAMIEAASLENNNG